MRVVLLYNPVSGYGKSQRVALPLADRLVRDGVGVQLVRVGPGIDADVRGALTGVDAILVVGGDGPVAHCADDAIATGVPLYHVPLGTENLFAREWGMSRRYETLMNALYRRHVVNADVGVCNGRSFLLMCSSGPDASVTGRVAANRARGIFGGGHSAYFRPVLAELLRPTFPRLRVVVDGKEVVRDQRGIVVVGNSRQYAMRVDPAVHADMTDGQLDVAFMPCASAARTLLWAAMARLRRHTRDAHLVYQRGRQIVIEAVGGPAPGQIDGEALPGQGSLFDRLSISLRPQHLPVLSARG
jgi:diacylglycerol kinase family enzyme